ncbi:MAG: glycosyltransferase, partial [Proteobacteria bacterium]
ITDGSTDRTPEIASGFAQITHLHTAPRMGKVNAMHRAMQHVDTEIVVFTDANPFP